MSRFVIAIFLMLLFNVANAQSNLADSVFIIPFILKNNHIYLRGKINNSKPLWILLDTGAPDIINEKVAKTAGFKLLPAGKTNGVGEAAMDMSIVEDVSFQLNGLTYFDKKVWVVSLQNVEQCSGNIMVDKEGNAALRKETIAKNEYQPMDAVLGANFFKTFVVEIDYEKQFLYLHDPKNYHYSGNGSFIPIEISNDHIFIDAAVTADTIEVQGHFMVDCGSMVAVILNSPFVEKNNLLSALHKTNPFNVCGIGGDSKTQQGMLNSLRIQKLSIKNPPALFSQAKKGVLASTDFDGTIGNAVLRHFKVIFDYDHHRMILEPNTFDK